jgi:hypothetical protein
MRLSLRRLPSRSRRGFEFPRCSEVPSCSKEGPDGPAKTCQKKCKELVRSRYQYPVGRSFCVASDCAFRLFRPLGFTLRQLQLFPPWLITDLCRRDDCST